MVELVVVIPVGPKCNVEFIADTIDSVLSFTTRERRIILMDDSSKDTGQRVRERHPDLTVLKSPRTLGKLGGLYCNLSAAFDYAISNFTFKALLRLDTDALLVGSNPEADAITCFESDPRVGSAGNYTHEYGGKLRDRTWVANQLVRQTRGIRSMIRQPRGAFALHRILPRARRNGYELGEEVFGGACFYSYAAVRSLALAGYLPHRGLARAHLEEDEVFGIALRACGYHFADLWSHNQSFACTWNGLPAAPEELCSGPAKVIHSVRDYKTMSERELRHFFRERRAALARENNAL